MGSKYVDITSIMQVVGCVYNNPKLLDITDKYSITEDDFADEFHKIAFGAIYKIYELGAEKITLENYIMKLFGDSYITPRIRSQIKQFREEYNYTYSGIHKALIYFFEIKKNSIEKANNGIGIVPYVYKDAYNYYYAIWEAQQKNEAKLVEIKRVPIKEVETIIIPPPERKIKKRNLFSFLDDEGE